MFIAVHSGAEPATTRTTLNAVQFSLLSALFFVAFYNVSFFKALLGLVDYHSAKGIIFLINISLLLWLLTSLLISLVTLPYLIRLLFPAVFTLAAGVAYFMDTYGIVIHRLMIQNVVETDFYETRDLLNLRLLTYLIILGVLPSLLLHKINITYASLRVEAWRKIKFVAVALIACIVLVLSMSMEYASFFRNHKNVRQMANPINFIYAGISYATTSEIPVVVTPIGTDAKLGQLGQTPKKPNLFVLVVGETARADHFSINGYARNTTPLLASQNIISFSNVHSCGTETAVSVPCMFSGLGRSDYSDTKAKSREGLLDVISHAGLSVLWRDNNSSCKGTCNNVAYENMQRLQVPELCNEHECFDEILLHSLDEKISAINGNLVLVLHQKGSHGPDYFDRYPKDREFFSPLCKTNQLQNCTQAEVVNAYDNTIRYTDYFLNSTIEWLKTKNDRYNTSLLYLSDHGESLGENNLYLHGMPYSIAPAEQKHVPFVLWFSEDYQNTNAINVDCLKGNNSSSYSHDNLFHTVLGMLNIETTVYKPDMDIIKSCRQTPAL